MSQLVEANLENVRQLVADTLQQSVAGTTTEIIFGPGGTLDSLGLVNFLADLEYRIAEVFGRDVVLASEQAMSRSRSPFRDLAVLSEYILEIISR